MKKPKMVLFDFGETLITETFDLKHGYEALNKFIKANPNNTSLEEVVEFAHELMRDTRHCSNCNSSNIIEFRSSNYTRYVYEYFNIELDLSPSEMERVFFESSSKSKATPNIIEFLKYLKDVNVRVAILSNMSFSEDILINWIKRDVNWKEFEFIITTSEYMFRKPSKRIFDLALKKARLNADEVWYCGNSSHFDVEASHNAGLYPVWYKGANWEDKDFVPSFEFSEVLDWKDMIGIFN